jgi:hypothetical protein
VYLDLLQQTVEAVVALGTDMQEDPEVQAAADVPDQTVQDQTDTLGQMIAEIRIQVAVVYKDKDSQVALELDLIDLAKTVIIQVLVAAQVDRGIVLKMTRIKDC